MTNIAVVTDSTAFLPLETVRKYGIEVIPLSTVFGNKAYEEGVELSAEAFYKKLRTHEELPTTSQPSIGKFIELYQKLGETHDKIISIHLSSGVSGTYQTALTAGEEVDAEIYGFDSEISSAPQGYYAVEAAKMAMNGETVDAILNRLEEMKRDTRAYFMVDDLNHLHRGGRLNGAQAIVGSLLKIKPILHLENKLIVPFEKVRTEKKALNRIYELFDEDARTGVQIRATVIHANRSDKADEIRQKLADKYPNANIDVGVFGPVVGTHLGEGSLGIGWCKL